MGKGESNVQCAWVVVGGGGRYGGRYGMCGPETSSFSKFQNCLYRYVFHIIYRVVPVKVYFNILYYFYFYFYTKKNLQE